MKINDKCILIYVPYILYTYLITVMYIHIGKVNIGTIICANRMKYNCYM